MDLAALIIPVEVNAKVALSFPIMGDGGTLLDNGHEMLRMIFSNYTKQIWRVVCVQKPGLSALCVYPSMFSLFFNCFCARIMAWRIQYIPCLISRQTQQSLENLFLKLYCLITSLGRWENFKRMYSYRSMGITRKKYFILRVVKRVPVVDIVMLINSLTVKRSIVGVPQSPEQFTLLPPTVRRVRLGSYFSGL